jgi:hypothetical protein
VYCVVVIQCKFYSNFLDKLVFTFVSCGSYSFCYDLQVSSFSSAHFQNLRFEFERTKCLLKHGKFLEQERNFFIITQGKKLHCTCKFSRNALRSGHSTIKPGRKYLISTEVIEEIQSLV